MSNFHSLQVVGRGSETQIQVGENINSNCGTLRVSIMNLPPFQTFQNTCLLPTAYSAVIRGG